MTIGRRRVEPLDPRAAWVADDDPDPTQTLTDLSWAPRRADRVARPVDDRDPEQDNDHDGVGWDATALDAHDDGSHDGGWEASGDLRELQEDPDGVGPETLGAALRRSLALRREAGSSPPEPLEFARRHAALVLVALVVAIGIAATYLFRAHADSVPLSAVAASAGTPSGSSSTGVSSIAAATGTSTASPAAGAAGSTAATTGTATTSGGGVAASTPATVTVQVLGAVRRPGVVTLRVGARVQDALTACGGLLSTADPAELNLATVLQDADQVVVGTRAHPRGEVRQGSGTGSTSGVNGSATASSSSAADGSAAVVDLNSATLAQLDALPGVGPVTAQKILDWRTQHGRFTSASELQEVDGIGPKTYARLAPHVRVGS